MSIRAMIVGLIVLLCACRQEEKISTRPSAPTYILFIDLTRSLNPEQQKSVADTVARLCIGMPARSLVLVFPLGGFVEKAGMILQRELPDDEFARQRRALGAMKTALPGDIVNATRAFTERVSDRNFTQFTCVSDAIRQAEQVIAGINDQSTRVEIVFISDMLEHCRESLLGKMVSLERNDLSEELAVAREIPDGKILADLRGANVTAVLPPTGATPTVIQQPDYPSLREFWKTVLRHCRYNEKSLSITTTLPKRLEISPERRRI